MALTKVSGNILDPGINVTGIVTATKFDGPFSDLTTTELDVTGISTFNNDVDFVGPTAGITSATWDKSEGSLIFKDNAKAVFGTGSDLDVYHDTHNYLKSNNGRIYVQGIGRLQLQTGNGSSWKNNIVGYQDDRTDIYHDGDIRLTTTGYGVTITGGVTVGAALTVQGDLYVEGTRTEVKSATLEITDKTIGISSTASPSDTTADGAGIVVYGATDKSLKWENSSDSWLSSEHIKVPDDKRIFCGTGTDLSIYHDGSNAYVDTGTGLFYSDATIHILRNKAGTEDVAKFAEGSSGCMLYCSNGIKLTTTTTGITVGGEVAASQDYPDFRPALDFNFASVKKLDPRITYTRSGPASYTDEFGIVKLVAANTPRFDHDSMTGECKGLLVEDQRTNMITYSTDYTNSLYHDVDYEGVISENLGTAPDGGLTDAFVGQGNTGRHTLYPKVGTSLSNSTKYTMSIFVKRVSDHANERYCRLETASYSTWTHAGGSGVFDLSNGTQITSPSSNITSGIETYSDGWYRIFMTSTTGTVASNTGFYLNITNSSGSSASTTLTSSQGLFVYGTQMEAGAFITSYIPTDGSTETRGGDYVGITGDEHTDFWNTTEGTYLIDYKPLERAIGDGVIIGSKRGTQGSGYPWPLYRHDTANTNNFKSYDLDNGIISMSTTWADQRESWALGFNGTNGSIVRNGTQLQTNNTNMTGLINATELWLGSSSTGSLYSMHVKRFMYYRKRITDSQLITLTS